MTRPEVIRLVLNKFMEIYDLDTSVFWPEDSLREQGVSDEMVHRVLFECLRDIGIEYQDSVSLQGCPQIARALVELVLHHASGLDDSDARSAA
jgi:hypothetical protein